jgi:transcriptional regulator with XRE-family HTH domain
MKNTWSAFESRLAKQIRTVRYEAGLSQRAFAARLGKTQSWVSRVESGEQRVLVSDLAQICIALGIDIRDLVERALEALDRSASSR